MDLLNQVLEFLKNLEAGPLMMILIPLIEVGLRMVKTEKPRSLLYSASDLLRKLSELFIRISELLDKVLQRTK